MRWGPYDKTCLKRNCMKLTGNTSCVTAVLLLSVAKRNVRPTIKSVENNYLATARVTYVELTLKNTSYKIHFVHTKNTPIFQQFPKHYCISEQLSCSIINIESYRCDAKDKALY